MKYAFDAALNKKMNNDSNKSVVSKLSEMALFFCHLSKPYTEKNVDIKKY